MGRLFTIIETLLANVMLASAAYGEAPMYDLSKDKVLYCVGYAHLDTQWRWDFCTTIDKFVRDTLDQNFDRFEKFPGYTFNFTGSVRYEMMKEYYPQKYEQLKKYIAQGRWFVSGSSVDEGDVNVPSVEAIIRQVLYGNDFFRREFGKESQDFMLPDCFGFPASLPSIWAHCGLKGFSTQKLTWGSAVGIPFKIGVWEGPDGQSVIAALDPGSYASAIQGRVDLNTEWVDRVLENGRRYGVWADYHYYGVGDQGGAPREEDVQNYLASIGQPDSQIKVALVASDQMFKDITAEQKSRLPRYKGDLLLTEHSAGTLTSQAYMKRWNRKNENLADAAERAAVAAAWLGGATYPRDTLHRSWIRLLANQMHDILPGTSIPRAYTFSWNDEIVAMNGFATVLTDSVEIIAKALHMRTEGVPLIVYNPLAIEREDVVEATVVYEGSPPQAVEAFDPGGKAVPTQVLAVRGRELNILFLARTPPVSWSVYDIRPAQAPAEPDAQLQVDQRRLESERYRVTLNDQGDVSSIYDKGAGREILAAPARLVFTREKPLNWPAWNMDWFDRQKPPLDVVAGPATFRIVEKGPVRVAIEVERNGRNSVFLQLIRLSRGDAGDRVEFATTIDWQSAECALKASFPLAVSNPRAVYNWGLGTIERGNNEPNKYEVPSHEWFDLSDSSGQYGVSVLEDCRYGSDKPSDNELRLTLLYTPGVRYGYLDQHSQDWGRHEMTYALYGHQGDWRVGQSPWQGRRLNQPLRAWQAEPGHQDRRDQSLFNPLSLLSVDTPQIDVRAVKMAEHSDRIIIRLQELWGREVQNAEIKFAGGVVEAEEVDGQERPIGPAVVRENNLRISMGPYSPKSFAIKLTNPPIRVPAARYRPVHLPFDSDVASADSDFADGKFDSAGRTIPAEMMPATIASGAEFSLGSTRDGERNALSCRGQTIDLPEGGFDRVFLLAAAEDDVSSRLDIGARPVSWRVQSWTGFIGQWDDRVWDRPFEEIDYKCDGQVVGINAGYIKRDPIAWFCTHRHHPRKGNEAYRFSYLYRYAFDLLPGESVLRLPDEPDIKVLAISVATGLGPTLRPAAPLYDDFDGREPVDFRHVYPPPPVPVHQGLDPIASVVLDRRPRAEDLRMGAPSATDFADQSSGRGVEFRYFDRDGEFRPHIRAGAEGDALPRLNDGLGSQNDDDISRCVWFDGEGRVYLDLQNETRISRINTYSHHRSDRAPQFFSVWASNDVEMPAPGFQHGQQGGWVLLAVVDTRELGKGGVHGTSIEPTGGQDAIGPFRQLLYVIPGGQGTFFAEIDVHAAE